MWATCAGAIWAGPFYPFDVFQMPRSHNRRTTRASWSGDNLQQALQAIRSGRATREVAISFAIPRTTLQRRLRMNNSDPLPLGRRATFSAEAEKELAERVIALSKCFFGITRVEIRKCAYNYAEINNMRCPFNAENKTAGCDWLYGFLRRNPTISLRQPEPTSINRITAFNKEEVSRFFRNLDSVLNTHGFEATRIFNTDETGLTTVQRPSKIFAQKGTKQVGFITSAERGKNVTAVCCFSAAGHYIPPMFIYPRKRMNPQLQRGGPAGALYECSDNGWMTAELFVQYLKHFSDVVRPSTEKPVLLIMDNHTTHCTLEAYEYCKENGIVLLTIPPHTSHRMQPLDVTFYSPLKTAYNDECNKFLKSHPHEKITPFEIAELFNKAFMRISTPEKAVRGFEKTGIFPFNPNVFTDEDFLAAQMAVEPVETRVAHRPSVSSTDSDNEERIDEPNRSFTPPEAIMGADNLSNPHLSPTPSLQPIAGCSSNTSFDAILPMPTTKPTTQKKRSAKKQHSEIVTSTPNKVALVEKDNRKQKKKADKQPCKETPNQRNKEVVRVKKRVFGNRNAEKPSRNRDSDSADTEDSEEDIVADDLCLVCGEFGKNGEMWIRCTVCGNWAHKACADTGNIRFVCDFCR